MDHPLVEWLASAAVGAEDARAARASTCSRRRWSRICRDDVLYRPKMGFAVPLARWFRGPLRQRVRDAVLGERLAETGWFDRDYLSIWSTHQIRRARLQRSAVDPADVRCLPAQRCRLP